MSGRDDHRKYDVSISKFLNGLFTKFRSGVPTLQKIILDALRNRLFFRFGGGGVTSLHTPGIFVPVDMGCLNNQRVGGGATRQGRLINHRLFINDSQLLLIYS